MENGSSFIERTDCIKRLYQKARHNEESMEKILDALRTTELWKELAEKENSDIEYSTDSQIAWMSFNPEIQIRVYDVSYDRVVENFNTVLKEVFGAKFTLAANKGVLELFTTTAGVNVYIFIKEGAEATCEIIEISEGFPDPAPPRERFTYKVNCTKEAN